MRQWKLVSNWGMAHDEDPDDLKGPFHAGILVDALRLDLPPYNPLLVASRSSGVWRVDEAGGPAIPLSVNWSPPGINCLAHGFYQVEHVYAGGAALYETDVNTTAPWLKWRQISLILPDGTRATIGSIYRMAVVRRKTALVLATSTGIWWARIPETPGGTYTVTQAPLLPGLRFSGLAKGPDSKVVAACWGTDLQNNYGIYVGDWTGPGNALQFGPRATINDLDQRKMLRVELASCEAQPQVLYAVAGGSGVTAVRDSNGNTTPHPNVPGWIAMTGEDFILTVLRSNDGGNTWDPTGSAVDGSTVPLFPGSPTQDLGGHTQWGFNLVVGVSPFTPDVVAVGLVHGFISKNGGKNWAMFSEQKHRHPHGDVHACYFDPMDANMMHVCTDGGIATTPDLGGKWRSAANRQLPNFEVHRFAVSRSLDVVPLAMSLQDNGDVAAPLYPSTDPWRLLPEHAGGDGILSMFTGSGHLVHHNNTESDTDPSSGLGVEFGAKPRACVWDPAKRRFSHLQMFPNYPLKYGVIPIDGTSDGLLANANNANDIEAIERPSWMNSAGEMMQAVGAEGEKVYGLFQKADDTFHWQPLGTVPHKPTIVNGVEQPYFPGAIASLDGRRVVVGMNNGLIFLLEAPTWAVNEISDPLISASITRIVHLEPDDILIIADARAFRWSGTGWTMLPSGLPPALPAGSSFTALAADRSAYPPRLFIGNDVGVWQSDTNGATWFHTNVGLPLVSNSKDLRTTIEYSGAAFVYLATWGWSVFRLLTNLDDSKQTVIIDGQMDIVDRQPGSDIWGHPKFTRIAVLGPLHPFEEYSITGDNGDEVRVELKIKCAWKADKSVEVRYSATLIDMGSDNEVTDAEGETLRIVFFGATPAIAFDMDSDEWWPDRAHVGFTVSNF